MRWARRPQYVYGRVYRPDDGFSKENVRLNRRTGRCEFLLWRAGEQGHKQDYWCPMGLGWDRYFHAIADNS